MNDARPFNTRLTDLAAQIYVNFVRDAGPASIGGQDQKPESERLARLSFELSARFHHVLDELNAESLPKNVGFTVQLDDIAQWSKPAAKS